MKHLPLIIAHRGVEIDHADVIELDVRCTKDQVLVVSHDDRLTLRGIKISSLTSEELKEKEYDVPLLHDVINALPNETRIELDLKQATLDIPLAKLFASIKNPKRVLLCSPSLPVLNRYSIHFPDNEHVFSTGTTFDPLNISHTFIGRCFIFFFPLLLSAPMRIVFKRKVQRLLPDAIALKSSFCTKHDIAFYHSQGIKVYVFVVNTPEKMERFIAMGVDGITTDHPSLLHERLQTL